MVIFVMKPINAIYREGAKGAKGIKFFSGPGVSIILYLQIVILCELCVFAVNKIFL